MDLTPVSTKMFFILYALFIISSIEAASCFNTDDLSTDTNRYLGTGIIVRHKRNDELSKETLSISEREPIADKLVSKEAINTPTRPTRHKEDGRAQSKPPQWLRPEMMEREILVKPPNQIVSLSQFTFSYFNST